MKPVVERLEEHFEEVRGRNEDEAMAVDERNHQLGGFDGVYSPVTRLIESVYLLGGEPKKARKLRLRFRRRLVNRRAAMAAGSAGGRALVGAGLKGRGTLAEPPDLGLEPSFQKVSRAGQKT